MDYTIMVHQVLLVRVRKTNCRAWDNDLVAKSWMIDELAHAGPEHLDPAFVAGFDRKQGYPDPAEDLDAFAAYGLDASSAVVDLARVSDDHAPCQSVLPGRTGFPGPPEPMT